MAHKRFQRIAAAVAALPALGFALLAGGSFLNRARVRASLELKAELEAVRALSEDEFVRLVAEGFERYGFEAHANPSSESADLILHRAASRTIVRCRDWRTARIGVRPIRELYAAMLAEGAAGALFVTAGRFRREATTFADDKPVGLVNGEALLELVRRSGESPERVEPYLTALLDEPSDSRRHAKPSPRVSATLPERVPEL